MGIPGPDRAGPVGLRHECRTCHVNEPIARISRALRVSPRVAWLVAGAGLLAIPPFVALMTRQDRLQLALLLVIAAILSVASLRWPILALAGFAALIPIEEAVFIEGIGTMSRLAGILFAVTYGLPRMANLTFRAMPTTGYAFVAWATVSIGWAIDPGTAWNQIQTFLQLFLIAVLVADFVTRRPEIVRTVLWVYSLSAAATAVVGIWAYLSTAGRATAIEDQNPAQFAAVLLPALAFGIYELLNGDRRILGGGIAFITALGVIVSGTRGAWMAVVIMMLLFVLPQLSTRRRVAAVAMTLVLAIVVYQVPGVPDLLAERTGSAVTTGGAGRTDIWSVAARIYQSAPVLGVGFANFPVAYTSDVVRASGIGFVTGTGRGPHDLLIGTLVELGPIGLVLLLLFLIPLVLRRGWGPDAATVQAALASLLTLALFLDIVTNRKQVWLVVGLAAGLAFLAHRNANADKVSADSAVGAGTEPGAIRSRVNDPGIPARSG